MANAEVRAWCERDSYEPSEPPDRVVFAAPDGSFRFDDIGSKVHVSAHAPGLTCRTGIRGTVESGSVLEGLTLTKAPAASLHGRVETATGAGVRSAEISVDQSTVFSSRLDLR